MNRNLAISISLLILCLSGTMGYGQSSSTGNWLCYFGNYQFPSRWNWNIESQYRAFNFLPDAQQFIFRTGIGYNLSPGNNNLSAGYAYIESYPYISATEKSRTTEHRLYQQFLTRQQFGRWYLQHRYRIEERFFPGRFALRFRYFLSVNLPLNRTTLSPGAVYLSAFDEIFLNNRSPVFDRNRLYGGIGYVPHRQFRFELGYMNQQLEQSGRKQWMLMVFHQIQSSK